MQIFPFRFGRGLCLFRFVHVRRLLPFQTETKEYEYTQNGDSRPYVHRHRNRRRKPRKEDIQAALYHVTGGDPVRVEAVGEIRACKECKGENCVRRAKPPRRRSVTAERNKKRERETVFFTLEQKRGKGVRHHEHKRGVEGRRQTECARTVPKERDRGKHQHRRKRVVVFIHRIHAAVRHLTAAENGVDRGHIVLLVLREVIIRGVALYERVLRINCVGELLFRRGKARGKRGVHGQFDLFPVRADTHDFVQLEIPVRRNGNTAGRLRRFVDGVGNPVIVRAHAPKPALGIDIPDLNPVRAGPERRRRAYRSARRGGTLDRHRQILPRGFVDIADIEVNRLYGRFRALGVGQIVDGDVVRVRYVRKRLARRTEIADGKNTRNEIACE